ncbi:cation:proton antiporter [Pseudovibrio sp. SPO723]|uniref:cation:proton antiporter domain-containing protein n=1 Tax=Nesiotobacter zosterae TaxID=392721 RepID=UPI0029C4D14F|nr:cation:proton antiporter [Pseudovibrio sp. SPO723]MDX5595721.1 cation:proton antiporter [Pseudovibrio sp. SPO723]
MYLTLCLIFAFIFLYSISSLGLEQKPVNGALLFTLLGLLFGPVGLGWLQLDVRAESLKVLAELTLALVLFTDAAHTNLTALKRSIGIPIRLLLIGLPLTILLGGVIGYLLFPGVPAIELALLAALLAPTDAALGKAVVTSKKVPADIRSTLNIESGLNDGICVPIVLSFLAIAVEPEANQTFRELAIPLIVEELGIGSAVGLAVALGAHFLVEEASKAKWISSSWKHIVILGVAGLCFAAAQAAGGSGFIAAFVGGLTYGAFKRPYKEQFLSAAEGTGDTFALVTWVLFGAAVVGPALSVFTPEIIVYSILSLTIIRMLPVYLSLTPSYLQKKDKLFIGWFGPRGLASVVFAIIILDSEISNPGPLIATAVCTITLSILLHGITAGPFTKIFDRT